MYIFEAVSGRKSPFPITLAKPWQDQPTSKNPKWPWPWKLLFSWFGWHCSQTGILGVEEFISFTICSSFHGLHGSAGTVLTAITLSYGKWRNSTPHRIKTPSLVEMWTWNHSISHLFLFITFKSKIAAAYSLQLVNFLVINYMNVWRCEILHTFIHLWRCEILHDNIIIFQTLH